MQPVFLSGDFLKFHGDTRLEHLEVVGSKSDGLFSGEDLLVLLASDLLLAHLKRSFEFLVDEQITPFHILEKNHVWAIVQKRLEPFVAVLQRLLDAPALADVLNL